MKLVSTRKNSPAVSFQEALFTGQAPDGGLYMPVEFPALKNELSRLAGTSYSAAVLQILSHWLGDEIDANGLQTIVEGAYSFAPVVQPLDEQTSILELFHGPTLSFKDFGAQFMAKSMGYFLRNENREITILVATSGDTGSAVAHAYHNVQGIRIVLLYPAGKVSPLQEKQFTTLGDNITALKVDGAFDDCQALVKQAFADAELRQRAKFSSANSINIGRLVPQSLYYLWGAMQMKTNVDDELIICVPSGNFGNMCAGLFARQMGLPVTHYIAAVNSNSVISEFVETGNYQPRPSRRTLSNAMDVGNPSNWERIRTLFNDDYDTIVRHMWSTSVDDATTTQTMQSEYTKTGYIADPHTAVGIEALRRYRRQASAHKTIPGLSLSTAHPAKFREIVNEALQMEIDCPPALQACIEAESKAEPLPNDFSAFKEFLWQLH